MSKTYTLTTKRIPSKRRNTGAAAGTVITIVQAGGESAGEGGGGGSGHTHANLADLDRLSVGSGGYVKVNVTDEHMQTVAVKAKSGYADEAGRAAAADLADNATHADEADVAQDLAANSPANDRFLSRQNADTAQGRITFADGLEVGRFVEGFLGAGAFIDQSGNAEVESIKVRSRMEVAELLINRLQAIEGDQLLTENDTVEGIVDLGGGSYRLYLRSKWDGYFTSMTEGSVLKGIYNSLANAALSSEQAGTESASDYYTCWLRVDSVNTAANSIVVTMYPDRECPAPNHPPVELMVLSRWGHQSDTARQSCLLLSSTEGVIKKLKDVDRPIITEDNIAATLGTVPSFVYDYLQAKGEPVQSDDDILYADAIAVKNLYYVPKGDGTLPVVIQDRGPWSATEQYYHKSVNADLNPFAWETSDVWHLGCRWRATADNIGSEPRWNNTDWVLIEGNSEFSVSFAERDMLVDPYDFDETLHIVARIGNQDITSDIDPADVVWVRQTWDEDGNERVNSDNAWAILRASSGLSLRITPADADNIGQRLRRMRFTALVTLQDGRTSTASVEL